MLTSLFIHVFIKKGKKMATLDSNNVYDFSDLGNNVSFKFGERTYVIPPIPPKKARELFALNKKAVREAEKRQKEFVEAEKQLEIGSITEIPESLMDGDVFRSQLIYINCATDIPIEEMDEQWPTRLVIRVVRLINDVISGAEGEEKKA